MDLKELERLAKLCHKYSIKSVTTPELSLTFDELHPPTKAEPKAPAIDPEPPEKEPEYSEEDILLWSASVPS